MKRGDLRWYRFLSPDKKRPVLILHRDEILPYLSEITIAPLTTTSRGIPSEVYLSKLTDGVPQDCVVNLDHVQTVSKSKIGNLIATLNPLKMKEVAQALKFALKL
jgi:mRNA interferase MazF